MRYYVAILIAVISFSCGSNTVIYPDKSTTFKTNHETFSYQEGDTTYVMQKYFLVLLKKVLIEIKTKRKQTKFKSSIWHI